MVGLQSFELRFIDSPLESSCDNRFSYYIGKRNGRMIIFQCIEHRIQSTWAVTNIVGLPDDIVETLNHFISKNLVIAIPTCRNIGDEQTTFLVELFAKCLHKSIE